MQLSIVIPAYNEEQRLPLTLQRIFEYLFVHYQGEYEVIVVDDGSTDATNAIVREFQSRHPQLYLHELAEKMGRGAAVKHAVFQTRGQYILEMDADGSVNEHAIVDFLNYFRKHPEIDVLIGSRTVDGSRILTPQPIVRVVLRYGFFVLARLFYGWEITDRVNGYKMFRREAARDCYQYLYDPGYFAEAEIVYIAERRGWNVKELPILWTNYTGSRVKPFREIVHSFFGLFETLIRNKKGLYLRNLQQRETATEPIRTAYKPHSILVTGGCGFMGSNFIRLIYRNHSDVHLVNLDLLTYAGNPDNLNDIVLEDTRSNGNDKRYKFVQGDICDESLLQRLFLEYQFDLVVHFAAESHVDRSIRSSIDFIRTNIEGTRALVEAARTHGVKRFIHISTDEIYGSYTKGYANEDWTINPSNPYAASKAGADHLVRSYIKTFDFPAIIIRGSNNYGQYQYPEKLIPLAISNLLEGKKIPIHGYGVHVRSWVRVEDFCKAVELISWGEPSHSVYNVAGEEKSVLEVLQTIARHLEKDLDQHRFHVNDRPGADLRYAVNSRRLSDDVGWKPIHGPFDESITEVIQWYINHMEWWKNIKVKHGYTEHYERQSKGQWT